MLRGCTLPVLLLFLAGCSTSDAQEPTGGGASGGASGSSGVAGSGGSAGNGGTAIELLALGTYLFPEWVKPAAFVTVATARVTSDGSRIEMDPGEGLPHLTWVGLRAKP